MSFGTLAAAVVVFSSSIAVADELSIASVCAEIDETRDTLPPTERAVARERLARALQDSDVLVVETDCTERYVMSHEVTAEGEPLVRIKGPAGARRIRNPDPAALPAVYSRMVLALLEAQEEQQAAVTEARAPATLEVREETETETETEATAASSTRPQYDEGVSDPARRVRTDAVWYLQALTGNYGTGLGAGVRVPVTEAGAFDLAITLAGGDAKGMVALGGKYLHYRSPRSPESAYMGFGLSVGSHTADGMTSSGMRSDLTGGVALNRTRNTRLFIQADLSFMLAETVAPSFVFSIGVGR